MGRPALVPNVIEQIIGMIMEGRLRPGDQINQGHLARELGVSPTPLREALHALAAEGLVHFTKTAGVQVSPITTIGIIENTELAVALEATALRKSALLLTEQDLDDLEGILDRLDHIRDLRQWYPLAWDFYRGLLGPCGYGSFLELIRKAIFQTMLVIPLYAKAKTRLDSGAPNLHTVLEACRRQDVEGAVRALETHNRLACQATVLLIQEKLLEDRDLPVISR